MWYVGLDVHVGTVAISIRNSRGVIAKRDIVPTDRSALQKALRLVRGRARIICESGPLAPWVRDMLETRFREVLVCDRRRTRLTTSSSKTDRLDADKLSDLARRGGLHTVHVRRGEEAALWRHAAHFVRMKCERSRIIHRLRALFLERGIQVQTHRSTPERVPLRRLTAPGARYVALAYLRQLKVASVLVVEARESLVAAARNRPEFALLQTIPYVGEIRASELLAVVGHPSRFRSLRAFWSYAGLGVTQRLSAEHRVENGKIVREERTRGIRLAKTGQPILKKVLRDIALHASIRSGDFREVYEAHLARGKTPAVARVALARKVAAIIYAVWRYNTPYCPQQNTVLSSG